MNFRDSFAALTCGALAVSAQIQLTDQHVDFGFAYEDGEWNLHVHNETDDLEYAPSDAVLLFGNNLLTTVPPGTKFSFLGAVGDSLYLLPGTPAPERLFLGFGSEELQPADWNGHLSIRLIEVHGPGHLFAWSQDAFGNVNVRFNSRDGLGPEDVYDQIPGSHGHLNLAFDQPGEYGLTLEASGVHAVDGFQTGSGTYRVQVGAVPEPGTTGLLLLGAAAGFCSWRQRRHAGRSR